MRISVLSVAVAATALGQARSHPQGNSAQGICDLSGNLQEWTRDNYGNYRLAPTDGSPYVASGRYRRYRFIRTFRGGSWRARGATFMSSTYRRGFRENRSSDQMGFRLACPFEGDEGCFDNEDPYVVGVLEACDDLPRVGAFTDECFCAIAAGDGGGGLRPVECQD